VSSLLSLEEAWERLLALAPKTAIVESELCAGNRIYLAKDLFARRTQPPADLSAMDGYAICGNGPWQSVGESRAGAPFERTLSPGQCARISTGAWMPAGAERVLIQENAAIEAGIVALAAGANTPAPRQHVRGRGFDFMQGDLILTAGTQLGPAQRALAIAAGHERIAHRAPLRICVLDSGNELAVRASQCGPHQIPASNGTMIAAMLGPLVGDIARIGPVPDDPDALAQALADIDADILITSGGASVGDHDLVQSALIEWGARIDFWKVAIKPGKPLLVATRESEGARQVILGLPGNPVSSFVTAFLFALPLVRAAMGAAKPLPTPRPMIAGESLLATGPRREFLRAVSGAQEVHLAGSQDSSALVALAAADGLIDRPAHSAAVGKGETVSVYDLKNP
jgi:molybdopterin molybdotransferase